MSSYLNFYLVPKAKDGEDEQKPLLFTSYGSNCDIYQVFREELNPIYSSGGDDAKYSELTSEDLDKILISLKNTLKATETNLNNRMEAYKALSTKPDDEIIEDFVSTKEYIEEMKVTIRTVEYIKDWVYELQYSDFEKVLINID